MKKLLPILILAVSCLLLVSFQYKDNTLVFEGMVLAEGNPLPGVTVYLEKEGLPEGKPYYAATEADGSFVFQINAHENERIFFKFEKSGYTTHIEEFFPNATNLRPHLDTILLEPENKAAAAISEKVSKE